MAGDVRCPRAVPTPLGVVPVPIAAVPEASAGPTTEDVGETDT